MCNPAAIEPNYNKIRNPALLHMVFIGLICFDTWLSLDSRGSGSWCVKRLTWSDLLVCNDRLTSDGLLTMGPQSSDLKEHAEEGEHTVIVLDARPDRYQES